MTSRKRHQIQEREAGILRVAEKILATQGWTALTMDSVLARVDFSKGTLYNHFSCREDLMVAFHTRCLLHYLRYFERGALFHGRPRERLVAAALGYELKAALDPQPFRFSLAGDILAAAARQRRQAFLAAQRDTLNVFVGIARDGIANGDLRSTHSPDFVALSAWATGVGAEHLPAKDLRTILCRTRNFSRCAARWSSRYSMALAGSHYLARTTTKPCGSVRWKRSLRPRPSDWDFSQEPREPSEIPYGDWMMTAPWRLREPAVQRWL